MDNNMEKYLPLGTVVMLKNGKKRIMITGFAAVAIEAEGRLFDYMGCLYPEGIVSSDKNLLFNHEQIDKIYSMGYADEEWEKFQVRLKETLEVQFNEGNSSENISTVDSEENNTEMDINNLDIPIMANQTESDSDSSLEVFDI